MSDENLQVPPDNQMILSSSHRQVTEERGMTNNRIDLSDWAQRADLHGQKKNDKRPVKIKCDYSSFHR